MDRFNSSEEIKIPKTVEFAEGATARRKGYPITSCPYFSTNPTAQKHWRAGWCDQDMIYLSKQAELHDYSDSPIST
jgi:hypothetical protein